MAKAKTPSKHGVAAKRVRRRLYAFNPRLSPEELAEDQARAESRLVAYNHLREVVEDTCSTTDFKLKAAHILLGIHY